MARDEREVVPGVREGASGRKADAARRSGEKDTHAAALPAHRARVPPPGAPPPGGYSGAMEGFGGLFGDPEELQRRMAEMAEQMQGQQRLAWADNAIRLAVEMTTAAVNRVNVQGTPEQQAEQIRAVMATVFPEAVTLVREAREGLQ